MPTYYITTEEEIKALWKERDEARDEAARLRDLIEQHRRHILGPHLDGVSRYADINLWESALGEEDDR